MGNFDVYGKKYLRIDAAPGSSLDGAVKACIDGANSHNTQVRCEFNGIDVIARPGETEKDVAEMYYSARLVSTEAYQEKKRERRIDDLVEAVLITQRDRDWTHADLRKSLANALIRHGGGEFVPPR